VGFGRSVAASFKEGAAFGLPLLATSAPVAESPADVAPLTQFLQMTALTGRSRSAGLSTGRPGASHRC